MIENKTEIKEPNLVEHTTLIELFDIHIKVHRIYNFNPEKNQTHTHGMRLKE